MGLGRRIARKAVRKTVPRSVRRVAHPVRTVKHAMTPRPVRQVSRAIHTVTNPLGAAENMLVNGLFDGSGKSRPRRTARPAASTTSMADVRAAEGAAAQGQLAVLMAVQRERFTPAQRPVVERPIPADREALTLQEWARLKKDAHLWQRGRRRELRQDAAEKAAERAAVEDARALARYQELSSQAEAWWTALRLGHSDVMTAALDAAFADNPAPVKVVSAQGTEAALVLLLPGPDVLPAKKAHVTPTGRHSSKAWNKTEFNKVYSDLLGAHLLATARETWATAPSLTHIRISGVRTGPHSSQERLFDVDLARDSWTWHDDTCGSTVLRDSPRGLNRTGRTSEVRPWPAG
jgi:hypothetical protein